MTGRPSYSELARRVKELENESNRCKQAEERLLKYQSILSAVHDPMSFVDRDYVYQAVNDAYGSEFQKKSSDIVGLRVVDLLGTDVFENTIKERFDHALAGEEIHYEAWIEHPVCGRRYMQMSYYPFFENGSTVTGVVVRAHDLTQFKFTEDNLRIYELIISMIKYPMSFVDQNYVYKAVNDAYLKIFQKRREEIIGHSVADLLGQEVFETQVKGFLDRSLAGEEIHYEDWFDYPGWGHIYVQQSYYPFYQDDKTITGIVSSAYDITDHKLTEDELHRISQELLIRNHIDQVCLSVSDDMVCHDILQVLLQASASRYGLFVHLDPIGNMVYTSITFDGDEQFQVLGETALFSKDKWPSVMIRALEGKYPLISNQPVMVKAEGMAVCRLMIVPIIYNDMAIGMLVVAERDTQYVQTDMNLLESIANGIAPILNARLQQNREEMERKQAEEELRLAHDELEIQVEKRTFELIKANMQLKKEIEERKQAEKALKQSEKEFRSLFENIHDVYYRTTLDGEIVKTSPYVEKMLGYTHEEFVGTNIKDYYVNPKERKRMLSAVNLNGSIRNFQTRLRRKDGSILWVATNVSVFRDEQGNIAGIEGLAQDITIRIEMEKALKQREETISIQYRGVPIPTFTWRRSKNDFILVNYNKAAEAFTKGYISYFVGKSAKELYKRRPDILRDFERCYRTKRLIKLETPYRMFTTDEEKYIALTIAFVPPDMVMVHMEDITERKMAEEKLKRSEKNLRLLSSQLLSAKEDERKRIAQELHDSVGQYLTSIKFKNENILNKMEKQDVDFDLQLLRDSVPIIQDAIDEVRRISMDLRPSTLDDFGILATISWLIREFQSIHANIKIETKIEIEEDEVPEELKVVIFRILQEGLNNVAKHSQARMVEVLLQKKGNTRELFISDNGVGFDVQEKFIKDDARQGFGLTSMEERAELSGGSFSVESQPGKGTTIKISWQIN